MADEVDALSKAKRLLQANQPLQALAVLDGAGEDLHSVLEFHLLRARASAASGNFKDASRSFETALEHDDSSLTAQLYARFLTRSGQHNRAVLVCNDALKSYGEVADIFVARAFAREALVDEEKSIQDYRTAVRVSQSGKEYRRSLMNALYRMKHLEEAQKLCLEFLQDYPGDLDSRRIRAMASFEAGDLNVAVQEANSLLSDHDPVGGIVLAKYWAGQQKFADAVTLLKRVSQVSQEFRGLAMLELSLIYSSASDDDIRDGNKARRLAWRFHSDTYYLQYEPASE